MDDVAAFLSEVVPRLRHDVEALHDGDVGPRMALWSHREPVTLFGAALSGQGWAELEPLFERLATTFSGSRSLDYEVLAAGASGDLGYVVAIEHTVAGLRGAAPAPYALRVTTVLRREDDEWKVVHRHADPYDEPARQTWRGESSPVSAPVAEPEGASPA
jgi:ketosteroid isomerase-like protein